MRDGVSFPVRRGVSPPGSQDEPREWQDPSRVACSLSRGRGHLCSRLCFQMLKRWTVARSPHQPWAGRRPSPDTEPRQRRGFRSSVPRCRSLRQDQGELGASQRAGPGEKPPVAHPVGRERGGNPRLRWVCPLTPPVLFLIVRLTLNNYVCWSFV